MNVIALMRAAETRRKAAEAYERYHRRMDAEEASLRRVGKLKDAERVHQYAVIALRAHLAEIYNPLPEGLE